MDLVSLFLAFVFLLFGMYYTCSYIFQYWICQPESAMLIQEYITDMTPSQLFVTYAGGLSTVGGVALVIFMTSGVRIIVLLD